jgi:aspartate racemase
VGSETCLGLLGGLGVGATVYYYEQLAKAHLARGIPMRFVMAHADMAAGLRHVRAGEIEQLAGYFAGLIGRLAAAGATVAAIPAVTPHICIRELRTRSPLPLISIADVTAAAIRARGLRRVALFGTRFTIESGFFGLLEGIEIARPRPDEIDLIHAMYFEIVDAAAGGARQRNALTAVAKTICDRDGVEAIVLAGTELALVFGDGADFPAVDCARLHLDEILRAMVGAL